MGEWIDAAQGMKVYVVKACRGTTAEGEDYYFFRSPIGTIFEPYAFDKWRTPPQLLSM
jgi:hypothetical protein